MLNAQRRHYIGLAVFIVLLSTFFLFHGYSTTYETVLRDPCRYSAPIKSSAQPDLRAAVSSLFNSIKHDITNTEYRDASGKLFKANQTIWNKPLGKKILIVDIDTRVPNQDNQILNTETINFETLEMNGGGLVSNAIMNHYLYAMIHGYDFKYYQAQSIKDHHDTWILPHALRELIPDYQFVVTMDADVTIPHMEVPLEWLFNRWGIQPHTSIALPWDTLEVRDGKKASVDSKGMLVLNTGFVVAQDSATTRDMLEKWHDCTSESRYAGCGTWAETWSHEQRAFSEYIRYDYNNTPETVVSIDCDDAMGYPGIAAEAARPGEYEVSDCSGNFVRHYTLNKGQVKEAGMLSVMNPLAELLRKQLLKNKNTVWYQEPEKAEQSETSDREKVVLSDIDGVLPTG
ncbi:hypothetical protein BDU57DRAFT_536479 [Ampelomyces quisqualis]|uniref:Nucleotide-diphospho-sugar transferase domain-containing protein n=1 Tax=Ampelomyces quisqualis TaxID=50730 RepID=A0A6A5QVQ3_AMPQU|nr:hypothetical protein BDU57DRAFT_536479 [Ampelomyces quisqualis]